MVNPSTQPQTSAPIPPSPTQHPHHHWIFGLLLIAIFLMIAIFAIFAYATFFPGNDMQTRNQTELPVIILDQQETLDAEEPEEPIEEMEKTITNRNFDLTARFPTFEYPSEWQVVVRDIFRDDQFISLLEMAPGPIWYCESCGGPIFSIRMTALDRDKQSLEEGQAYADKVFADLESFIYTNLTKTSELIAEGTLSTITGKTSENEMIDAHNFEQLIFEKDNKIISIQFNDLNLEDAYTETKELIKSTINFSNIK